MTIAKPDGQVVDVAMPAWIPGSYKIRDFAKHVYDLEAATNEGTAVPVQRLDKQTWRIEHRGQDVEVRYRVFANERSVRTSHVDDEHASLNGPSLFLYLPNDLRRTCELEVEVPAGWSAHTALELVAREGQVSHFRARSYDELVDAPIELGTPTFTTFQQRGTRFEYVLSFAETVHADPRRLASDAERIVAAFGQAMGSFPMPRYVFLMSITAEGGGGLEHDNSAMMMMKRGAFASDDAYRLAAGLTAHEFFHAWNVRRIRDAALRPYDYTRENHTNLLWFHEGFTEAVESLILLRATLVDPSTFLQELGTGWSAYAAHPGRNRSPIEDVSFDAWIRHYQPAANHRNVSVSYYDKGKFIGLALDLELRLRSHAHGGEGSLIGVFRRLMESHGATAKGITYADIVAAASVEAGEDMTPFFDTYVKGTEDVPLAGLAERMGVKVDRQPVWDDDPPSSGGRPPLLDQARRRVYSGVMLTGAVISDIEPGSPAELAGLMRDDEIMAVDRRRVRSEQEIQTEFARRGSEANTDVLVVRNGRVIEKQIHLGSRSEVRYRFSLRPASELSNTTRTLRNAWLAIDG